MSKPTASLKESSSVVMKHATSTCSSNIIFQAKYDHQPSGVHNRSIFNTVSATYSSEKIDYLSNEKKNRIECRDKNRNELEHQNISRNENTYLNRREIQNKNRTRNKNEIEINKKIDSLETEKDDFYSMDLEPLIPSQSISHNHVLTVSDSSILKRRNRTKYYKVLKPFR